MCSYPCSGLSQMYRTPETTHLVTALKERVRQLTSEKESFKKELEDTLKNIKWASFKDSFATPCKASQKGSLLVIRICSCVGNPGICASCRNSVGCCCASGVGYGYINEEHYGAAPAGPHV